MNFDKKDIGIFILKQPVLSAILAYTIAFTITCILNIIFHCKEYLLLEKLLLIISYIYGAIYAFNINEKMSLLYKLSFSFMIMLLNAAIYSLIIYSSIHTNPTSYTSSPAYIKLQIEIILGTSIITYLILNNTNKSNRKSEYSKLLSDMNTIPDPTLNKLQMVTTIALTLICSVIAVMALGFFDIIQLSNIQSALLGIVLLLTFIFTGKYLKKSFYRREKQ